MKRLIPVALTALILLGTFVSCSADPEAVPEIPVITSLSSSAEEYADIISESLKNIPDKLILGIGTNDEYDVDMKYFEDDGYIIKKVNDSVVLFGKTEAGLELACQKYVNDIKSCGSTTDFTHSELSSDFIEFAERASANTADNRLTLAFKTDTHLTNTADAAKLTEFANAQKFIPIDLYVHGGDLVNGNHSTEDEARDILSAAVSVMTTPSPVPFVSIRGNHDDNSWTYYKTTGQRYGVFPNNGIIDSTEWRDMAFTKSSAIVMDEEGSYGYMDHEGSKIRVLFVDSCDIPYEADSNEMFYYGAYTGCGIRNRQLNFMAEAMQFADKGDDAENWAILIVSHVPIETMKNNDPYRFGGKEATGRNFFAFLQIIEAYKNGTDITISQSTPTNFGGGGYNTGDVPGDFAYRVTADFSKNGPGEVIGFISGHTHIDNYSNLVGYGSYTNNHYNVYPELSLGYSYFSFSSSGYSVITVDRSGNGTGKIYVDKYGTSVVTSEELIADGDNARVTTDPVALGIHSSSPLRGSLASGNYTVAYSQPEKRK